MDLFGKRKEIGKEETPVQAPQAMPAQPPVKESVPVPVLPDSAQLAEARVNAKEQIKAIEAKIAAERAAWEQRVKEKNEQRVTLKTQLEMIARRGAQERAKKDAELALLKQQQEADLAAIERTLEAEIKNWTEKLSVKEKEAESVRHESMIAETQATVENEQKLLAVQRDLEQAQQNNKKIERAFLEEQTEWMGKIRAKDDEILQIMTQISLREAQTSDDEQRTAAARKEREDSWQAQTRALEEKLAKQQAEWTSLFAAKEAERISLKAALEEHLLDASLESEKKNTEIKQAIERIEERSRLIEAAIVAERTQSQEELKTRDEELNKLRVTLMLSESQENADREKRIAALKEAEALATGRIKEIAAKIEEEKALWTKSIADKDEELNIIKIQTALKLKELHDTFEKRRAEAAQEKIRLSAKLIDLNAQFAQEKATLAATLESKQVQISSFQAEWQAKQQALVQEEQQAVSAIKTRKEALEKELTTLEQNLVQEKAKWTGIIWHKETELEAVRKDSATRQNVLRNELDFLEVELKAGFEPLTRQTEAQEEQLWATRKRIEEEIAKKESERLLLTDQFNAREEQYLKKIKTAVEKNHGQEMTLAKEIDAIKARISETQAAGQAKLDELAAGQTKLAREIAELVDQKTAEKEALKKFYQTRRDQLTAAIAQREAEQAAQKQQWEAALAVKTAEVAECEAANRKKLEQYQLQLTAKENELTALADTDETDIAAMKATLAKTRADFTARTEAEQQRTAQLAESLRATESKWQKEINELKEALDQAALPLEKQHQALEQQLVKLTEDGQAALSARDRRIEELKAQQEKNEQKFKADMAQAELELANAKTDAQRLLTHLTEDSEQTMAAMQKKLADTAAEIATKESTFAQRKEAHAQQCAAMQRTAEAEKQQLKLDIERLTAEIKRQEKEHPQLVAVRVNEIAVLEQQLSERAVFYAAQQEQAEQNFEKFRLRSQQRLDQATAELSTEKAAWLKESSAAQDRLQAVLDEYNAKEAVQQEEMAKVARQYAEEKAGIDKQKLLLEESLADLQKRTSEELGLKDKELQRLTAELAEKEKVWESNWRSKEAELASERNLFIKQIATLEASRKQEEELAQKRVKDKENEITFYKNQYAAKVQALTVDINAKKQAWIDTNANLANQVTVLQQSFDQTQKKSQEMRAGRENELSALKSNIEFWEAKTRAEDAKRLAAWEEEKASLETQVKQLKQHIDANERTLTQKLSERTEELAGMQASQQALEDAAQAEWSAAEAAYQHQQATMSATIASLEQGIREGGAAVESECAAMDQAIEKLKLETTFKDTVKTSERNKLTRKWDKLKYALELQFKDLQDTLEDERREWESRITAKEEEIKTLGVRLEMRRDRLAAEVKRRHEESGRIVAQLTADLQEMQARYNKAVPAKQHELEEKKKLLLELQQDVAAKEAAWQQGVAAKDAAAAQAYSELSENLSLTEAELKKESARLKDLLALREKQIHGLTLRMKAADTVLVNEKEHTGSLIASLQQKATEFRSGLRQLAQQSPAAEHESTPRMFEQAVGLYNANHFAEANDVLSALITSFPMFAGAYQYSALCLYHLNEKAQAKLMAERALELDPKNEALQQWIDSISN